jgi:hypothetical protein
MTTRTPLRALALLLACLVLCTGQTCDNAASTGSGDPAEEPSPPPATITVQLINGSAVYAIDVSLYASNTPVTDVATDLFVPQNQVTTDVGFAGTGLIPPGETDTVELPCATTAVFGTPGGIFVDVNSGAEIGPGAQRVAQRDVLYGCGDIVTLRFRPDGAGFTTDLLVE